MKIKPVKKATAPGYPTEHFFINNPQLFLKSIPARWYKNKIVSSALSVFILSGLNNDKSDIIKGLEEISVINPVKDSDHKKEEVKVTGKVAPIFVHGDGSGAIGCIVISPPVFISEEEALKIITEELKKENIIIDTVNTPTITFNAEALANDCWDEKPKKAKVSLKFDGKDNQYDFNIEYLSEEDYSKFRTDDGCWSSVQDYDMKRAAELFREELVKKGDLNAVIFYDPMPSLEINRKIRRDIDWERVHENAKDEAKELLIAQIEDFIQWLKKEKILE